MPGGTSTLARAARPDSFAGGAVAPAATRAALAVTVLGALAVALERATAPFDTDGLWHVAAGEWMLEHGALPRRDPFSWTANGEPWRLNSYAFDLVAALAHRAGGRAAVSAVMLVGLVAFAVACHWSARRAGARPWAATVCALVATVVASPFVVERPQSVSFVCFAVTVVAANEALAGSQRWLVGLGVLVAAWSNLHMTFLAGIAVVVLVAGGEVLERRRVARPAAVVAVAALAGLCNPYGVAAYTASLEVRSASKAVGIFEWQPIDPSKLPQLVALVCGGLTLLALWRTGRWRRPSVVLPLAVLAAMAVDARRNIPFFIVLAAPELALAVPPRRAPAVHARVAPRRGPLTVGLLVGLAAFVVAQAASLRDLRPVTSATAPVRSAAAIPAGCRVLNGYVDGAWIIYSRHPEVLVSMDPRNDMYGDELVHEQAAVLHAEGEWRRWLDEHDVGCVLARTDAAVVDELRDAGWPVEARDAQHALLVRP
jgi:hypothetical protein